MNDPGVGKGDTLYPTKAPDGTMRLSPYDEVSRQIEVGEVLMDLHRGVFRALAK